MVNRVKGGGRACKTTLTMTGWFFHHDGMYVRHKSAIATLYVLCSLEYYSAGIFKLSMGSRNRAGIGLSYRARICKPFRGSRNRFLAWRAGTTSLFDVQACQAGRLVSGIDFWAPLTITNTGSGLPGYTAWRNWFFGIDSWAPEKFTNSGSV